MSPRLRSDEAFGLETFWWRPDDDGRPPNDGTQPPSHGTLRFTPDHGVELTVFDLLTDLTPLQVPGRLHALFGETLEHKPCVLFDALPITSSGSLFGAHNHLVVHAHQFVLVSTCQAPMMLRARRSTFVFEGSSSGLPRRTVSTPVRFATA
jgi:hypothetical protein